MKTCFIITLIVGMWVLFSLSTGCAADEKQNILFAAKKDGNVELYTISCDGKDERRITNNQLTELLPQWAANGSKIIFMAEPPEDSDTKVFTINADGTDERLLTDNELENFAIATPFGNRIGVVSGESGYKYQIWDIYVMNIDGSERIKITDSPNDDDVPPFWSPDGKMLCVYFSERSQSDWYIVNADGTDRRRLTQGQRVRIAPQWGPDSERLLLTYSTEQIWSPPGDTTRYGIYPEKIYMASLDSSELKQLTTGVYNDKFPVWSPDGRKIAFFSNRGDANRPIYQIYEIYVMNADGSEQKRLTQLEFDIDDDDNIGLLSLSWSPDSKKLAFAYSHSHFQQTADIYTINADGSELRKLTQNGLNALPAWSAEGKKIAYISVRSGDEEIDLYVVDADGNNPLKLASGVVPNFGWRILAWEPTKKK